MNFKNLVNCIKLKFRAKGDTDITLTAKILTSEYNISFLWGGKITVDYTITMNAPEVSKLKIIQNKIPAHHVSKTNCLKNARTTFASRGSDPIDSLFQKYLIQILSNP